MTMIWKVRKADNFKSQNSLSVKLTIIQCLRYDFVCYEPFLEPNTSDVFALFKRIWKNQLDGVISLWEVILLWFEKVTVAICKAQELRLIFILYMALLWRTLIILVMLQLALLHLESLHFILSTTILFCVKSFFYSLIKYRQSYPFC